MNAIDYTFLLNRPNTVRERHLDALDKIVSEFPYFQSAMALQLKSLYNQNSFRYNQALKITAAHTTDRTVLFDFITSGKFTGLQQAFAEQKQAIINEIIVSDSEILAGLSPGLHPESFSNSVEQSIKTLIKESEPVPTNPKIAEDSAEPLKTPEQKLELGKPLAFAKSETHSFQEWLQLASIKPIERAENQTKETADPEKQKKSDLIDKFIETNPKIISDKNAAPITTAIVKNNEDTSYLMTETLAKVYLEQKKYQKAIQAYEILILKYPEKSSLFADRISDIKTLQQNNN